MTWYKLAIFDNSVLYNNARFKYSYKHVYVETKFWANIGPGNDEALNMRPAIIWTIDDLVYLCIYATFGFDELRVDWYGTRCI